MLSISDLTNPTTAPKIEFHANFVSLSLVFPKASRAEVTVGFPFNNAFNESAAFRRSVWNAM